MNILVTLSHDAKELSAALFKPYTEYVPSVDRLEWQAQHVIFHLNDGHFYAVKADRILEMISYEN